jgi:hypothetical protein
MKPLRDGQALPPVEKQREILRHCIALLRRMEEKRQNYQPPVAEKPEDCIPRGLEGEKPQQETPPVVEVVVIPLNEEERPKT